MGYWWLFPTVFFLSFILTGVLRRYAISRRLIDVPNTRSSHSAPTPRGGGVSIVLTVLFSLFFLFEQALLPAKAFLAMSGAGGVVALIGFIDDHGHIAARWRLLGHALAGGWAVYWLGGLPALQLFGFVLDLEWFGVIVASFYLVWMLNLYNFMDGIDGIASVEAITVCLGACLLYWLAGFSHLIWSPMLLVASVAGFLFWNFPPARIFMGDAGSGFLGVMLGVLSLQAAWASTALLWGWIILLGVFVVDATFTLMRRLLRGDRVYEAHRSHAYQFASRRFGRHLPVTLAVGAINLIWLLPIAAAVVYFGLDGVLGILMAYTPLVLLALVFQAGTEEQSGTGR